MAEKAFIRVRVAGPYACFSRPEMKVERVSYETMTPSAARGVLDAILWRPQMRWLIRRIDVLKPIRFQGLRRNELQSKIAPRSVRKWMAEPASYKPQPAGAGSSDATPRGTLALREVAYVIEAEPHVFEPSGEDNPVKYAAMFNRRLAKGQCFHRPYLGCREFACWFSEPQADEKPIDDSRELGSMLYDIAFSGDGKKNRPVFFQARLEHGSLDTHPDRVLQDVEDRKGVLRCSYKR